MTSDDLDDAGPPGAHDDLVRLRYYLPSTHPGSKTFFALEGAYKRPDIGRP